MQKRRYKLIQFLCGLQPKRIQNQIGNFILTVDNQHNLIICLRPASGNQFILIVKHRADQFPVCPGQHFLPDLHIPGHHIRLHGFTGNAVSHRVHHILHNCRNIAMYKLPVFIPGINVEGDIIAVLDHTGILAHRTALCLEIITECRKVIRIRFDVEHGIHQIIHDRTCIYGVARMIPTLPGGHKGGNHARQVYRFRLNGDRVA